MTGLLAAGLMVAGMAACTGHKSQSSAPGPGSGTGGSRPAMHFPLALASYPAVSASLPAQPLGTSGSSISGLDLEVWTLTRAGDKAVLLVFAFHNPGSSAVNTGTQAAGLSAATNNPQKPGQASAVSGVSAVDGTGLKQYLPYMANPADDNTCLCSTIDLGNYDPGKRVFYAALLAAPPSGVKSLDVVTGLGSVPNVPLS